MAKIWIFTDVTKFYQWNLHISHYFCNFADQIMNSLLQSYFQIDILELIIKGMIIGIAASAPMGPVGILCVHRTQKKGRWFGFVTGVGRLAAILSMPWLRVSVWASCSTSSIIRYISSIFSSPEDWCSWPSDYTACWTIHCAMPITAVIKAKVHFGITAGQGFS